MKKMTLLLAACAALPLLADPAPADPAAEAQAKGAAWLLTQQQPDGSFFRPNPKADGDVGITGLVVTALARSGQAKSPQVAKAVDFLLKHVHEDGSIWNDDGQGFYNYRTSIALMALSSVDPQKHADVIKKAQGYIIGIQKAPDHGNCKPGDPEEGGIGYGDDGPKNDLSNTQMAVQALKESGCVDEEVFKRAAEFAMRCQNIPSNPINKDPSRKTGAGSDGGCFYGPGDNDKDVLDKGGAESGDVQKGEKPHPKSYGSMTYAGLLTMVYANLGKDDPRVAAAMGWIKQHYSLEMNPGLASAQAPLAGKQGLYYYYLTFAKAMKAYGEASIETPDKNKHRWAAELRDTLVKLQKPSGIWINEEKRWMEALPILTTSYALEALRICREDLDAGH